MIPPLPTLTDALAPISEALDALSSDERVNWTRGLGRGQIKALYALAGEGGPLDIDWFAGEDGQIIVHEGQNSLPAHTVFQKRFVRWQGRVQGYNHQSWSGLTGPGHFLVRMDGPDVVIDYNGLPDSAPDVFPKLVPNEKGVSRFVYGYTIDRMRRVSRDCTVGAAEKNGKRLGAYFVLTRIGPV